MRVLICGSRDWTDYEPIRRAVFDLPEGSVVIHGAARGADTIAAGWAQQAGHEVLPFPIRKVDWEREGRGAGHLRNQRMLLEGKPDLVLAFKDNLRPSLDKGGTEDMIRQARAAGVPVRVYSHE